MAQALLASLGILTLVGHATEDPMDVPSRRGGQVDLRQWNPSIQIVEIGVPVRAHQATRRT